MTVVRSETGVEVVVCSVAGDEAVVCLGSGSRTAGGGGTTVSRAIKEQERMRGRKIAKCGERECVA
jgi:hypothetical protein